VHQDLPPKLIDDIEAWCDPFLQVVADLETLLTGNRIFKQRNVDIGVVTLQQAWEWGFSGVMVRGSGAAWDLRKAQPYECYARWISIFRSARTAIVTTATASAWKKCASRCAS